MSRGNGFTRRGLFGAGAAGAAAAGLSACGDDYFEPATSHGKDVPNVVLIFTDSTRADFIGHYNKHFGYGNRLADTPNLDALGRDSLAFRMAVPEAMPTGPARRGLLTGVRSFPFRNYVPTPGLPVGPGWISIQDNQPIVTEVLGEAGVETGYCTDNPFLVGPRFANFRRTLDFVKPSFSQGAYRFLNKPFKRPAPRSAIERYLLPELSDSVEVGPAPLDGRVELDLPRHRQRLPDRPRLPQRHQPRRRPEEEAPLLPRRGRLRPARAARRPARSSRTSTAGPKGIEKTKGITPIQPFETPYSWVIDMKLDPETIERVRELYAAEIAFTDEWIGRLMNRLADQNLLDETVVIYSSDHGLTLGEQGIVGKHGARAQWHIYHVPFFIRHPEGKLAGQWDDFYALEPRHLEDGDVVHGRPRRRA